jgi:hypothetical protein
VTLRFTTRWSGFNNHEFDVWWIDLSVKTALKKNGQPGNEPNWPTGIKGRFQLSARISEEDELG